ncbi:MAG: polyketide cyclase [Alphaproteobacteria bacterium]|nr:polyketide cyclase [Alphaproteobacteria bacterium]
MLGGIGAFKPISGQADDTVNCSITQAFELIGYKFFDNYPKWCPQVVDLELTSPPPVQTGSQGRQVTRDRGIDSASTFLVSEFTPATKLEIKGISEPFRSAYELISEGPDKTRVSFTFELLEIDLMMRPFQKLIKTALQDGALESIENIKNLLEGSPTSKQ